MPQTPRRYVFTAKIPQKLSFAKSAICKETWKIISETLAQNQNPLYFCTRFREGTTLKPKRKRENKRPERGFDARREIFENICNLRGRTGHIEIYVNTRGSYKAQDLRETKKKQFIQRRVWSWLRMNASERPNTCKSRGNRGACSRWRPAHGWVTRMQPARHRGIAFRKGD